MAAENEVSDRNNEKKSDRRRFSFAFILDASLSVTFLVLAAYIAIYASRPGVADSRNLLYFSALMGAYGIWRTIRTGLKKRGQDDPAE
ncbi:MAG: hypothetical protein HGB22_08645 [Chlorobiaceae bacterium]|nr:hypothetical protein [Chlorobiaceae bacterium]